MREKEDKIYQFSANIVAALQETIFNKDSEYYVGDKLEENSSMTDFVHAMSNVAPLLIYNQLTGDKKVLLEFNHMANNLVVQYMEK